ncbi:hypothetical protein [Embleya sp. MST-111070]|uniref:hypothetical protein n=1 Tax=Embleya sp. MST-111070 TaxID=3398231 RepID=UPI003F73DB8A
MHERDHVSDTPTADAPTEAAPRRRRTPLLVVGGIVTAALVVGALTIGGAFDGDGDSTAPTARERPAEGTPPPATSGTPEPPSTVTRITHADVKALTDARTRALRDGDAIAFVTGIDPANAELMAAQHRLLANLRLFPFARAEFLPPTGLDAVRAEDAGAYSYDMVIVFSHQLDGIDSEPVAETYTWTLSRASIDAPVQITKIVGSNPTSAPTRPVTYPAAWDGDELAVVEREHILLAVAATDRDRAAAWADRAELAAKRNAEAWHGPAITPRRFAVFVPTKRETVRRVLGDKAGLCELVTPARPGGGSLPPVGARVTFDGTDTAFVSSTNPDTGIGLLRRELAEAMVGQFAQSSLIGGGGRSRWVSEGFAYYLAGDNSYRDAARAELRAGRFNGKLPLDTDLLPMMKGDQGAGAGFHVSMLTIRYLAEKYGAAKADEFVVAMYANPASLDAAIKAASGLERDAFEAGWADYVRAEIGG